MEYENFTIRYNVMDIFSVEAFTNIKGGLNRECKDVYFMRAIGAGSSLSENVKKMDRVLTEKMFAGQCRYNRVSELPKAVPYEDIQYYSGCYSNWVDSGRNKAVLRKTDNTEQFESILGAAFKNVVNMLQKESGSVSESIEKNFIVKLMYWVDEVAADLVSNWNPKMSMKFVVSNVCKKQEYLFCYLLTQLGIDVLMLQTKTDIEEPLIQLQLSKMMILGAFADCEIFKYCADDYRAERNVPHMQAAASSMPPISIPAPQAAQATVSTPIVSIPPRPRSSQPSAARAQAPQPSAVRIQPPQSSAVGTQPSQPVQAGAERRELEFEELALLASSVVMIAIHNEKGEIIGSGSGIMIGAEGYILTNSHVAFGGRAYSVRIEDDETVYRTDEMIKYNSVLDLAIIRIDRRLKPLSIYKGEKGLVRGQKVVAIGSPLGLFNSVSDGIISGFRKIDGVDMIQFTAPTSHGSSGGAVLNMYGEVIGISTAGFDSGQNINLAMGYECINDFIRGFI